MVFNSFHFIAFFIAVVILYYILPQRLRWALLLTASYYFYMQWKAELILLIVFTTFTNYVFSLRVYNAKNPKKKKLYLRINLIINFGLLFIFKYLMFITQSVLGVYSLISGTPASSGLNLILPMGISFYTFQAAAYSIDVYRGRIKPERHFGIFSLFITFFPQLVAGPIERSGDLLPQFYEKHPFRGENLLSGAKIMLWGFFKKVVIADRLAVAVNSVYNSPGSHEGLAFILASVFFAFQIYCDFSGYSDIAMGAARILGFRLSKNFENPYLSGSVREFWKRWHITLSSWFMDYLYIPIGGKGKSFVEKCRNLLVTFLVSGLWHGANWTFVIWGAFHGACQIAELSLKRAGITLGKSAPGRVLGVIITFILVVFGWIFFRANTVGDAFYIIGSLGTGLSEAGSLQYLYGTLTGMGLGLAELAAVLCALLILVISELCCGRRTVFEVMEKAPYAARLSYYLLIALAIMLSGVFYEAGEFIYFQF